VGLWGLAQIVFLEEFSGKSGIASSIPQVPSWMTVICLSGGIFREIGHCVFHSTSSLLDDGYFGFQEESRGNRKRWKIFLWDGTAATDLHRIVVK
jgi:hypothetical protein